MRLKTVQIVAALAAAIAFVLAFIAAGIAIVSALFMAMGLAAVAWLVWSLLRHGALKTRPRDRETPA